jgi:hypothetical protein
VNVKKEKEKEKGKELAKQTTIAFLLNSHFIAFIKHLSSHEIVQRHRLINKYLPSTKK